MSGQDFGSPEHRERVQEGGPVWLSQNISIPTLFSVASVLHLMKRSTKALALSNAH